MKRMLKSMRGVTLLEVMLVLAIAAMIIVMSVRYYQSASSSQQANTVLQQIQGIVAAADGLAQAGGMYTSSMITSTNLSPLLPGGAMVTPWGQKMEVAYASETSFTIDIKDVPSGVCPLLLSKLGTNNHFANGTVGTLFKPGDCQASAATPIVVTYVTNP